MTEEPSTSALPSASTAERECSSKTDFKPIYGLEFIIIFKLFFVTVIVLENDIFGIYYLLAFLDGMLFTAG